MKRVVTLALLLCILAGIVFAGGTAQAPAARSAIEVTPPGEFPIVREPVTLEMLAVKAADIEDLNTNEFTRYYEELTNVRVVFDQIPAEQKAERLNITMASGDYPGVIVGPDLFNRTQLLVYGSQGIFQPLNGLIDSYMPLLSEAFDYNDYFRDTSTAPDGNIYGFPWIAETLHVTHSYKMWVYEPFMNALGIEKPQTLEQFRAMLVAFRDGDPNGTGARDTIPLAGAIPAGGSNNVYMFLMNAFIYADNTLLEVRDGTLRFVADRNEWRSGLRYVRGLYEEGLIAPDSFTQNAPQLRQLGENPGTPILGAVAGLGPNQFSIVGGASGRFAEFTSIKPLIGPDGERRAVQQGFPVRFSMVLTDKVEHPAVVARWLDMFYTPLEGGLWAEYGLENVGWERAKPGELGLDGRPAEWRPVRPWGQLQNIAWVHTVPFFNSEVKRNSQVAGPRDLETILYRETVQNYVPYAVNRYVPPLFFTEAQALEMAQIESNIRDYVYASAARFITGDLDIERDWTTYLNELRRIGVDRYTAIYQEAYSAKYR